MERESKKRMENTEIDYKKTILLTLGIAKQIETKFNKVC